MQAASGSQCKEMKRGLTWALFGLIEDKTCCRIPIHL